jgi:hypothetical protein
VRSSSSISSTGAKRLEDGTPDEEALGEDVARERLAIDFALRLGEANLDHLPRVVPLIHRGGRVESLVALQADKQASERTRQHLGDLGLAHARLAFPEKRPSHLQREKDAGGEPPVGEVVVLLEERQHCVHGGGELGLDHWLRGD